MRILNSRLVVVAAVVLSMSIACNSGARALVGFAAGGAGPVVRILSGEVRQGDFYTAGELVEIAGRLNGDLVASARRIRVDGRIDGDVFVAGETVDI
jgi:hypothetical protein